MQTLREKRNLLSVAGFAESQNSDTRQSLSLPSVAVGKDLHLAKSGFAECQKEPGTRQRAALSKGILCRVQHSAKKGGSNGSGEAAVVQDGGGATRDSQAKACLPAVAACSSKAHGSSSCNRKNQSSAAVHGANVVAWVPGSAGRP